MYSYERSYTFAGKMDMFVDGSACQFAAVIDMNYMVYLNFFGCVLLPLCAMSTVYFYIYSVVRKQMRKIAAVAVSNTPVAVPTDSVAMDRPDFQQIALHTASSNQRQGVSHQTSSIGRPFHSNLPSASH
jgi:hypothetical protein